jgi:hypothetical protein
MQVARTLIPALLLIPFLVFGMWYCYPQYDDTLMEILRAQHDSSILFSMQQDRPAWGWVFQHLDELGLLWSGTIVLNAIGWAIIAALACRLAGELFPGKPEVAIAAGLLCVAPVLVEMQFTILNNSIYYVGAGMLAILLLMRDYRAAWSWCLGLVVAFALIGAGSVVIEYVTAVGLAGGFLLFMLGLRTTDAVYRMRLRIGAVAIVVAAVVGYIGLELAKVPTFRPTISPTFLVADGLFRFAKLPFRLFTALYQASGAALLREFGNFAIDSYETIVATLLGLVLAAVTVYWARRIGSAGQSAYQESWPFALVVLLGMVTVGLLPFLLMGRRPNDVDFSSRWFDPVLPASAALTAGIFLSFLPRRATLVGLGAIAFIAGYATVSKALAIHGEVAQITQWGEAIRPHLATDGATIAIVPTGPAPRYAPLADDILTCQLSRNWPLEERRRFWARSEPSQLTPDESSIMRGAKLDRPVTKILLVQPKPGSDELQIWEISKKK